MKKNIFTLCFLIALFMGVSQVVQAAHAVPGKDNNTTAKLTDQAPEVLVSITGETLTKKQQKRIKRGEKRLNKLEKKLNKKGESLMDYGIDLNDPVKKWMWFWIFGWGVWLLLYIIAVSAVTGGLYTGSFGIWALLATLGWIAGLFGTVALIIWLVKMAE